ncbi:MAG: SpoIIE family protein phosphatase [Bacillota bacterium]|nr:SpoIIE family protein phosphatase [Bacillota bacterium]
MITNKKVDMKTFYLTIILVLLCQHLAYNSTDIESYFNQYYNLKQVELLIRFSGIVVSLLILNTSYFTVFNHRRLRMVYFVVIFQGFAIVEILANILLNPLFIDYSKITFQLFDIFYELMFAVIAILIAFASYVDIDKKIKERYCKYLKIIPVIEIGFIMILLFSIIRSPRILVNHDVIINFLKLIQLIGVSFAIIKYIKLYYSNLNKYARNFASGLTIILLTRFFEFILTLNEYQLLIESLLFVVGLWFLNVSTFRYNIDIPYTQLKDAQRQINLYTENLEKIVDKRTEEITSVNQRLTSEIENAKLIQQSLLPAKRYEFKNVLFISDYFPCERLSGDFYDIYPIDEENIGMYILDVSGHGISAALMTMFCNNYVKSSERLIKRYRGLKPHRNIKHFYDEFNKMNFPDEMHMVLLFATYNINTGILKYSNGGLNNFPIVKRANGDIEFLDKNIGFPICKLADIYVPEYESDEIQLNTGDRVMFFTDGLIDEKKNQIMTENELIGILERYHGKSLDLLDNALIDQIDFKKRVLEDDITYFVMEIQ